MLAPAQRTQMPVRIGVAPEAAAVHARSRPPPVTAPLSYATNRGPDSRGRAVPLRFASEDLTETIVGPRSEHVHGPSGTPHSLRDLGNRQPFEIIKPDHLGVVVGQGVQDT